MTDNGTWKELADRLWRITQELVDAEACAQELRIAGKVRPALAAIRGSVDALRADAQDALNQRQGSRAPQCFYGTRW
jgi:hypothetical protein